MSSTTNKSATRIITVLILIGFGAICYALAPIFLPIYRWTEVDFDKIAKAAQARGETKITSTLLQKKFKVEIAYLPRNNADPRPFLLMSSDPPWHEVIGDPDQDETGKLVRCTVIGDRNGERISDFLLGSGQWKDRFFRVEVWRLPPGSLGKDAERPILLYDNETLTKFSIGEAEVRNSDIKDAGKWQPDDDGYAP
jgi:hypothetical protein